MMKILAEFGDHKVGLTDSGVLATMIDGKLACTDFGSAFEYIRSVKNLDVRAGLLKSWGVGR